MSIEDKLKISGNIFDNTIEIAENGNVFLKFDNSEIFLNEKFGETVSLQNETFLFIHSKKVPLEKIKILNKWPFDVNSVKCENGNMILLMPTNNLKREYPLNFDSFIFLGVALDAVSFFKEAFCAYTYVGNLILENCSDLLNTVNGEVMAEGLIEFQNFLANNQNET